VKARALAARRNDDRHLPRPQVPPSAARHRFPRPRQSSPPSPTLERPDSPRPLRSRLSLLNPSTGSTRCAAEPECAASGRAGNRARRDRRTRRVLQSTARRSPPRRKPRMSRIAVPSKERKGKRRSRGGRNARTFACVTSPARPRSRYRTACSIRLPSPTARTCWTVRYRHRPRTVTSCRSLVPSGARRLAGADGLLGVSDFWMLLCLLSMDSSILVTLQNVDG
jgi:hypothetical protein